MDVCVMIEGQEGVTWDEWVGLARDCESLGFEGLFRSDHYLSFSHPAERGALDAWATLERRSRPSPSGSGSGPWCRR